MNSWKVFWSHILPSISEDLKNIRIYLNLHEVLGVFPNGVIGQVRVVIGQVISPVLFRAEPDIALLVEPDLQRVPNLKTINTSPLSAPTAWCPISSKGSPKSFRYISDTPTESPSASHGPESPPDYSLPKCLSLSKAFKLFFKINPAGFSIQMLFYPQRWYWGNLSSSLCRVELISFTKSFVSSSFSSSSSSFSV